ncbi:MAG TPA: LysM peptidoglycan-binding domain-containing protein, partial [Bacteroidales bacterium]|nr:LysM peptidoglycan-binding domain-containing protein [Bacteroidales bacterium]
MNNFLKSFLLILFLVVTSTLNAQDEKNKSSIIEEIGQKKYYIHLVQPGEDLQQVAELYEVTIEEIYKSTPGLFEGDKVQPNHILRIPLKDNELKERKITDTVAHSFEQSIRTKLPEDRISRKQKPDEKGIQPGMNNDRFKMHTIKPSETLFSLSRKYNVDVQDISNANPGLATTDLDVGQKLKIPVYLSKTDEENASDNNVYKGIPFSYYTVKPKETVFRISKNFGISQNELIQMNPEI